MDSIVIVARPALDDRVNRISSEKGPHLTIAYLGDQINSDSLIEIVEFVQHAASQLSPFGMSVDRRGTLGSDDADVLFFEDSARDLARVKQFRAHLLQNDSIARAYASVEQYPEWTPHLTLGYPETPAHKDTSDNPGIHYVSFDRIAVWMGDSEGPTFRLKYDDHGMDMAMSDMTTAERGAVAVDEMFHYGTKGMKWGVTSVDKASTPTLLREKKALRNTKDVTVTQRKAGTFAKSTGGQRQKATDDAVKAVAARQKAKKSTTDSLSNAELKAAVERMQLEQQFSKLDANTKRRGSGFVSFLFSTPEARKTSADLLARAKDVNKK